MADRPTLAVAGGARTYPDPVIGARAVLEEYGAHGVAPEWPVPAPLEDSLDVQARTTSSAAMTVMPLETAVEINGCLVPDDMARLVDAACRHLLDAPLRGVGIELGAGLGVLAATVARLPGVEGVLALELCRPFVETIIPRTADDVLGPRARSVVPVYGSFDGIGLPDADLDFAVEIGSLHHAHDLHAVLREVARVLRPGAPLVAFDRVQPDDMPDWLRDQMLDRRYSEEWMAKTGQPGVVMTRRENGEQEIRRREWVDALSAAGFRLVRTVEFVPAVTGRMAAKGAVSALPRGLRRRVVALPLPPDFALAWLRTRVGPRPEAVRSVVFAPVRTTGILARRA